MSTDSDGRRDFDFHMRRGRIRNRRLARRLEGCTEWLEFEALQDAHLILGGLGNIDSFTAPDFPGGPVIGMTLRLFDPRTRLWSIYWADDRSVELQPPMVGRFENGRGLFHGDETFAGKPIKVRFLWSDLPPDAARWEQAFSTDGGATWEVNWVMEFSYDRG
ncbi:MAG TPA: hypothetical protein VK698_02455 [Kofleriaceae bacterium]|nr:hypothetical protein [Kofleriaceae bacterium]